jgi:hypothetical protein
MQGKRMPGESAKQVAIDVLRSARKPLHTKEITKRVIDSGRCSGLKGKTPEATIAAMLAVGSKAGGPFKRVDKGTYALGDPSPKQKEKEKSVQPQKRNATPRAKKRQSAKRQSVGSPR